MEICFEIFIRVCCDALCNIMCQNLCNDCCLPIKTNSDEFPVIDQSDDQKVNIITKLS